MNIDSTSVVIITGASRGIGRAAAIEFGRKGATVVLASRDTKRMEEVAKRVHEVGGKFHVISCDVAIEEDCRRLADLTIREFKRVDVLVNNAGAGHYASAENLTTKDLDRVFRTNLYGTIWCTQGVLPHMKKQGRGHIVNVSTIISKRSLPFMTAYCMTKFAMNAFDEGLRVELRASKIGVSLVCPGLTKTDFQENATESGYKPPVQNYRGMSAERVGVAIVRAVEKNRRHVNLTLGGKLLLALNRLSPGLVDMILDFTMVRRQGRTK